MLFDSMVCHKNVLVLPLNSRWHYKLEFTYDIENNMLTVQNGIYKIYIRKYYIINRIIYKAMPTPPNQIKTSMNSSKSPCPRTPSKQSEPPQLSHLY